MEHEEVLANREPYNPEPSIYFLLNGANVIYVGSSLQPMYRIGAHSYNKQFTHYSYYACNYDNMISLEIEEIIRHQPLLNQMLPPNPYYKSIEIMKREFQVGKRPIVKVINKYRIQPVFSNYYDARIVREELLQTI